MPSMRFLMRQRPSDGDRERFLYTLKALARSLGADPRNPKWTSNGSLEIDIFVPTREDFLLYLAAVEPLGTVDFWRDLNVAPKHMDENELISEAREYFNDERYWECHETLEGLWRTLSGDEKRFLQGVILVCAAFVHHQKSEDGVALGVLRRARPQLEWDQPMYHGIDVPELRRSVSDILRQEEFSSFVI